MSFVHSNLAISTVVAPLPDPPDSDNYLTLDDASGFPSEGAGSYVIVMWPDGENPDFANAEIAWCAGRSGDLLVIARGLEGTTAKSVAVGWNVALVTSARIMTDMENGDRESQVLARQVFS